LAEQDYHSRASSTGNHGVEPVVDVSGLTSTGESPFGHRIPFHDSGTSGITSGLRGGGGGQGGNVPTTETGRVNTPDTGGGQQPTVQVEPAPALVEPAPALVEQTQTVTTPDEVVEQSSVTTLPETLTPTPNGIDLGDGIRVHVSQNGGAVPGIQVEYPGISLTSISEMRANLFVDPDNTQNILSRDVSDLYKLEQVSDLMRDSGQSGTPEYDLLQKEIHSQMEDLASSQGEGVTPEQLFNQEMCDRHGFGVPEWLAGTEPLDENVQRWFLEKAEEAVRTGENIHTVEILDAYNVAVANQDADALRDAIGDINELYNNR
jgi:hypothetical protein